MKRRLFWMIGLLLALVLPAFAQISISNGRGGQFQGTQLSGPSQPRQLPPLPQTGDQILFIGNSLTYVNSLPAIIAAMFHSQRLPVFVDQYAVGSASLGQHATDAAAARKISSRRWNYVVLQDQSVLPSINPDETLKASRQLCAQFDKTGATPVYYLTWGYRLHNQPGMDQEMQLNLDRAYGRAAQATHGLIAPVGPAWQAALAKNPQLPLYGEDGIHPAPEGSYLAACVFYAVLARRTPIGLPGTISVMVNGQPQRLVNVADTRARFYQQLAWDTVQTFSIAKLEAAAAQRNATLPTVDDVRRKLRKTMPLAEVTRVLGAAPDQRNDVNHVYIFKLRDDTLLWITYGKDGVMSDCQLQPKQGQMQRLDLPS
jgi:hypothetical protein